MLPYPLREVREDALNPVERGTWPATLDSIRAVLDGGFELGPMTVLVGENGSGKSTLVEAIALAYGLSPEGGSTGAVHSTRRSESDLAEHLKLVRNAGASRRGYFLRAETMHGLFTYLESNPSLRDDDVAFHDMSHGESFLQLVGERFAGPGLWVLDEPESALSFRGCMRLLEMLASLGSVEGAQILLATHSPILASLPGATVYELGSWGLHYSAWSELELVSQWRTFFANPDRHRSLGAR